MEKQMKPRSGETTYFIPDGKKGIKQVTKEEFEEWKLKQDKKEVKQDGNC